MPVRVLPSEPKLGQLELEAEELLLEHAARLPEIAQKLREFHPGFRHLSDAEIFKAPLAPRDARDTIARERGFADWAELMRHLKSPTLRDRLDLPQQERIEDARLRRAVELLDAGETVALRERLKAYPAMVHQRALLPGANYFRTPTLIEFVAENPVRRGRLAPNLLESGGAILEASPDQASCNEALMLVATGSVVREGGLQIPLIDLLCAYGAEPDGAARMAAVLDEHDAVRALIRQGAAIDLPIAAALGMATGFESLFERAPSEQRHLALAVAAQFGRVAMVQALLDAGEDPDRYNPPGGHSHATPLHQAAGAGHAAVVRLLVERGARLNLRDVLWRATPADWAAHEGHPEIERYLRDQEAVAHLGGLG